MSTKKERADVHFRAGWYEARTKYLRRTMKRITEADTIERARSIARVAFETTETTPENP